MNQARIHPRSASDTSAFFQAIAGLAVLIVGLCVQQTRRYISVGSRNRHVELFVYGFAAAGLFYAFEFFASGGY